jgi:phosphatidylserine decarboxylase
MEAIIDKISNSVANGQVKDQWLRTAFTKKQRKYTRIWLNTILDELSDLDVELPLVPSVENMKFLLETDGVVRMYVTQMLEQSKGETREGTFGRITSINDLLKIINYIITRAPKYNPDPQLTGADTFPLSSLFTEMMATDAGESAFRNVAFNDAIIGVLQAWCDYLDSEVSTDVLNEGENGWLSPSAQ